jgi:hypothetical protein
LAIVVAATLLAPAPVVAVMPVEEIVEQSVRNSDADWNAAPQYSFTERDIVTKHDTQVTKTYHVVMLEGSPYNKMIELNGEPLSPAQAAAEERKFRQEIERRRGQSASERRKRVGQYEKERRQDRALMSEMIKAFEFKLLGEETVDGHRCYALEATPKENYQPISRDTKVLKGMRGELWIDAKQYQWVKVHAEVFKPVAFGLFIADVEPGTEFTLEQRPVKDNVWLPSHFATRVKSRILGFSSKSMDDEVYSDYQRSLPEAAQSSLQ